MTPLLEIVAFVIVAGYVVVRARLDQNPRAFLASFVAIAVGAFLGEDSCIRLYGFYSYAPEWHLFVDRVPLGILMIWPVVVLSSRDLARAGSPRHVVVVAAAIVLADASIIEPIAVSSSLWTWTSPGPFAVPPIGVLGWGFFAVGALWALERQIVLVVVAGPLAAHALLLATWWGVLRWVPPSSSWGAAAAAGVMSVVLTVWFVRAAIWRRLSRMHLNLRVPAVLYFMFLLATRARPDAALWALTAAFLPPWLALRPWARRAAASSPRTS